MMPPPSLSLPWAKIRSSPPDQRSRCEVDGWLASGVTAAGASLLLALLSIVAASPSHAQLLLLPEEAPPTTYPVSRLEPEYDRPHPDLPPLDSILPIELELVRGESGWAAPLRTQIVPGTARPPVERFRFGGEDAPPVELEASGLARLMREIVARLHAKGVLGVDVRPATSDIDLVTERDLRPAERTALAIRISVGRIKQVRTIAVGDRVKTDWKIDNEIHTRIRDQSPLQPTGIAGEGTTDLLDRDALEAYLYRLNRHLGRRVEAALSPADEPGEVVLDYRVLESKPWYVYAQAANTGTSRTNPWTTRFGAAHRQVTDRDDIFSFEYLNSGLEDVNGVRARYQAPFFGPKRPDWMNRQKGTQSWLDWLPRERIPWWGIDRLRWEVDFGWGLAKAGRNSTFQGLANDRINSSQFQYSGRFIYELWQYKNLFVDVWGGLRLRDLEVENRTNAVTQDALLVLPGFGIHAERINQVSTFGLDLSIQGNANFIDQDTLDGLGRDETDGEYAYLDFNLGVSTFLEPFLNPRAWLDPSSELSSTLAHELALGLRGQYAFDYRLIPQASQTVGGLYSVRGYDQSVAVGDTVIVGSVEYRFHVPRALPVAREPMRIPFLGDFRAAPQQVYGRPDWDLTLRAFVDFGRAIRNNADSGPTAGPREFDQTLIGAGVGAELMIKSNFRARIDWATALKGTSGNISNSSEVGDSEIHVLFSVLY